MNSEKDRNSPQNGGEKSDTADVESGMRTGRFSWVRRVPPELPIFLFYVGMAVFLTWPVAQHFSKNVYGIPSDNLGQMWQWWWIRNAVSFGARASFSPLIGFPFGQHFSTVPAQFILEYGARFLLLFTNQVIVYNWKIVSSFALSGITMYYLVRYLTRNKGIAFFGGFAYLICAYHAVHAMLFVDLAQTQWMPLYILLLLWFMKKPNFRNGVFLWASAILVAGTSVHYAFFMAVFTASFLLGHFAYDRIHARRLFKTGAAQARVPVVINKDTLLLALLVIFATVVIVVPVFYASMQQPAPGQWPTRAPPGSVRDVDSARDGAATPQAYVVPLKNNFLLGWVTRMISPGGINAYSNSLYLGISTIALTVFAFACLVRRGKGGSVKADELNDEELQAHEEKGRSIRPPVPQGDRPVAWGLLAAAGVAFVLSMPPYFKIGGTKVPLPSVILRLLVPWLRWYMRMGVVVVICFVLLACYGLSWLLAGRGSSVAAVAILCVTIFLFLETALVPPFKGFALEERLPRVFERLDALNVDRGVVIYPAYDQGYFPSQQYLYYQESFKTPMLNGALDDSDGEALRRTVYNPFNPATPGILSRFNIRHVLYLDRMFEEYEGTEKRGKEVGFLPPGLQLEDKALGGGLYDSGYIFRVAAPGAELVPIYQGDITIPHIDEGRVTVRLVESEGLVRIVNYAGRVVRARVLLPVTNLTFEHSVTIFAGDRVTWKGSLTKNETRVLDTGELTVPREGLELVLSVTGAPYSLNPDESFTFGTRKATLKLGDVVINPL